ncbi:MAG TPA: alpha/beta fold hydrolase, partial [Spirochaetia bacterium]|nr:alpha/beta fold hydrolase [Spirochaetia bacterium]
WAGLHTAGPLALVGHSMGGLVAMAFALAHPRLTSGVASLDIAPRPYAPEHGSELKAFHTDISRCRSRAELDSLLAPVLPDSAVRQFILTNAVRNGDGFRWRLNVRALETSTLSMDFAGVKGRYDGPALLVAGGRSSYVTPADSAAMLRYFPAAAVKVIPEADHWLHVSAPDQLLGILGPFLDAIKERLSRL